MEIKSLNEIKAIIKKFPEASGAGYVIQAQLAKIARSVGLPGYDKFLDLWNNGNVLAEKVYKEGEEMPNIKGAYVTFYGPALFWAGNKLTMGIKKTIENIEEILDVTEEKK